MEDIGASVEVSDGIDISEFLSSNDLEWEFSVGNEAAEIRDGDSNLQDLRNNESASEEPHTVPGPTTRTINGPLDNATPRPEQNTVLTPPVYTLDL